MKFTKHDKVLILLLYNCITLVSLLKDIELCTSDTSRKTSCKTPPLSLLCSINALYFFYHEYVPIKLQMCALCQYLKLLKLNLFLYEMDSKLIICFMRDV